ncbi:MAG: SUMF1/EgtB/PvdO family nonheme iron enzyme [Acidobacteria bacterium]|nr:SUMF1/EgtB/PvdO family nonheme iron enzyme [Acidobacteriota bacterium]
MTRTAQQSHSATRPEDRPSVFISYCRDDKEHVDRLVTDLTAAGLNCWIDRESIPGGEDWMMAIAEGIAASYVVVPVMTSNTLHSQFVRKEIVWAQKKNKRIVPWVLDDVMDDYFPLVDYQGVLVFNSDHDHALTVLLKWLPPPPSNFSQNPADDGEAYRDKARAAEMVYLDRLMLEELINSDKYTPMAGASERKVQPVEMRAVFELLPMSKGRQVEQERRRFENAVEEILKLRRAVLLGEPGGGKTTTIWKLAAELVDAALKDKQAPIPLLIRLGRWTDAEQPLPEFIASQLGDLGEHLDTLLQEKRAALLLDGLNELPASQHKTKYAEVQQFIEQHPKLLAVVSCRELDYTIDLEFDRINITPLDPIRIREFAGRYLGETEGENLFWRIAGGDEVKKLWPIWQNAGASFDLFWNSPDIPKEKPDVYGVTTGEQDRIWREKVRGKHSMMELARNPYMLLMLTSVYAEQGTLPENRGGLFELFVQTLLKRERIPAEEQTPLTDGLAKVAYEMQSRRAIEDETESDDFEDDEADAGNALTVLPRQDVAAILGERLLYLAGSASILSMGEQVRFTHQLLQEYFAAKFMDGEIRAGRLKAADIWPPDRWWERTNWEEAAILLAGLYSDDCSRVVEWIAEANPEVAAQCVVRSGAALANATRERLRTEWIYRLTDLKDDPNPLSRAAVGRALAIADWDNRKGVGVVEINGVTLPDIEWIRIPEGEFQYGDESKVGNKQQKLWLPEFYISQFPVTYTQFQTFVDDQEGISNARWFAGLTDDENERPVDEQYFKFSNHPRESVSWYQAMAFCRWLSWRWGTIYNLKKVAEWAVRLPTEFEWEKAARGTDGKQYPWGNGYDANKGNTLKHVSYIRQTCAVGIFPNCASSYGVEEMSGNVWEWCLSDYQRPQIDARKENLRKANNRVTRGGSWDDFPMAARADYRLNDDPASRRNNLGFRVVAAHPPSLLTSVGDGARERTRVSASPHSAAGAPQTPKAPPERRQALQF